MRHSYASFAFLTPVGAPADMYFTPLASGGGSATCLLFLEVSAEAPRLFLNFSPIGIYSELAYPIYSRLSFELDILQLARTNLRKQKTVPESLPKLLYFVI